MNYSAEEILSVLGDQRLTTREIATELDCHPETANRRLRQLEEDGLLTSTRGGQVLLWTRERPPHAFLLAITADRISDFVAGIRTQIAIKREGVPSSIVPTELRDHDTVRAWTVERSAVLDHLSIFEQMYPGDRILFTWEGTIVAECALDRRIDNPQVGDYLWPETVGADETEYPVTLLLSDYRPRSIPCSRLLGLEDQSTDIQSPLVRLPDDRHAYLVDEYSSLENALAEIHSDPPAVLPGESEADMAFELPENGTPPDSAGVGKTERTVRALLQHRLTRCMREAYENQCAICGTRRLAPSDEPEIDVAHFSPLSQGGEPVPQNSIALCQVHHWALDTGWLAISDEYEVLVRDLPAHPGFEDFSEFAGTPLSLPDNDAYHPDPTYLQEHRERFTEADWRRQPN